jgi:HK97 family phage major capsid protein
MLPSMRQVPFRARTIAVTTGVTGSTVAEGAPKVISNLSLTGDTLDEFKSACVLVVTEELAKFDNTGGDLFNAELSNAVAVGTDGQFIGTLISGVTPAGSSGVTAEHVRNDLRGMLASITTTARSRLFLLMRPATAKTLSVLHTSSGDAAFPDVTYRGGTISGIEVVVSDAVVANTMVLVDAQQVAAASSAITLDQSRTATVQLESAPDSPPVAGTTMVSLWQQNLVGLRAERFFGATKLTTTGVAWVTGVAYVGDSPGP